MSGKSLNSGYIPLPYKNHALALFFAVVLGPIGLLYSSVWGGIIMFLVALIVVNNHFIVPVLLTWVGCCLWAVLASQQYNQKLLALWMSHEEKNHSSAATR